MFFKQLIFTTLVNVSVDNSISLHRVLRVLAILKTFKITQNACEASCERRNQTRKEPIRFLLNGSLANFLAGKLTKSYEDKNK